MAGCGRTAVAADRQVGVVVHVAAEGGRVVGCFRLGSFQVQARRPVTPLTAWSSDFERTPVSAVLVCRLGVDQRWQRPGLGIWLMWHALELAATVAPAVRARLVVAHGETERGPGFDTRFGFRAFTAILDSATCRCGTFRPPSRPQWPQRTAPPSWSDQHLIVEPTQRARGGRVGGVQHRDRESRLDISGVMV